MENLDALNMVVTALGGTGDGKSNADAIAKIAGKVPDATLPSTAGASEGDVLTVDGGKWKAKAPQGGGGGGVFSLTFTKESDTYTADKTFAEIQAAIEAGEVINAVAVDSGSIVGTPRLDFWDFTEGSELLAFSFISILTSSGTMLYNYFDMDASGAVSVTQKTYTLTEAN
jgi:hypothetical protein